MPIGIIVNCLGIVIGGVLGTFIGPRLTKMSSFFATFFQKKFLTLFTCYSLFIMT